jgi:hypothetical protein
VWDGATLPVPIEDIADTHVGLLVRVHHAFRSSLAFDGEVGAPSGQR